MTLLRINAQRYINPAFIESICVTGRQGNVQVAILMTGIDEGCYVWRQCKDYPAAERELAKLAKTLADVTA